MIGEVGLVRKVEWEAASGFFLGGGGKMVYEIKKGKPFSKKCKGFLVKWKSFSV
jgi:hypothetical protein